MSQQQQKIPSTKLIIYRSHRFSLSRQNNIKYGFFSPKLLYSATRSPKELRKRITDLSKKDYINMISYSLTPVKHEYNYFMRFITRISSIRHLSLVLLPVTLQSQISEYETRKVIKKILKICSRAKKLQIVIVPRSAKTQLSFKYLNLAKSYKNFFCSLWSPIEKPFEKLSNHLLHTRSKHQNYFNMIADPDFLLERTFDFDSFANSLRNFDLNAQNLALSLCFTPLTNMGNFLSFAEKTFTLPSLTFLSLEIQLSENLVNIFNILQLNKRLKSLRLQLTFPQKADSLLPKLEKLSFESLTSLNLTFDKFENTPYFPALLKNFASCGSQLSSLHVLIKRSENFTDAIVTSLIESLLNLKDKLQSFYFKTDNPRRTSDHLTIPKIQDFYNHIGSLENLKELALALPSPKEAVSSEVLCESLNNLTQLQCLDLNLVANNDPDATILQLANVLPNLFKLDTFMLCFAGGFSKPISVKVFNQILASLALLKSLSHLELNIKCENVDEKCAREFVSEFSKIKGLNYLRLYLEISPIDMSIQEYLRQKMFQIERKIEAITSVKS